MSSSCTHCGKEFLIAPNEETFYTSIDVPNPAECPDCRRQRRLMFRNFFNLYHRECDLSGKKIISMYHKDVSFPVYEMHEWWSDKWDGLSYGKDVDFSRSLFEQMLVLHKTVPRASVMNTQCENTDYCNLSFGSRNCYLVFGNVGNEDCSYGHIVWQSKDCYDCLYIYRCERCYQCIDCVQGHSLAFSRDCDNCASSMFLVHCVGCKDCFGCVGLKNKQFHIFNEPHAQEEYRSKIASLNTGNVRTIDMARGRVAELIGKEIVKFYHGFGCENVTGDYLYNCKNIHAGYDMKNSEDCRYCATMETFKDSQDCNFCGAEGGELCYQSLTVGGGYRILFSHTCQNSCSNLYYCDNCYGCKHCFGCVGLKQKQFCILNKQYSKEEYEKLLPQLIERMKRTPLRSSGASEGHVAEFGQFFPRDFSPFGYNETIAQEYFPLSKKEVAEKQWRWKEEEEIDQQNYMGPVVSVPEDIKDVDDSITSKILRCDVTGKLYKIIPKELQFYRDMKLPLPRKAFLQRQKERFVLRNPRHLWDRHCAKCKKAMQTTYAPERAEKVYCEECYLATVY